ncbi:MULTISPECIES: ABC transporter substrate-binding protein [Prauserella salsuginis group]|uniref:NitT/TauT family transport system substrate-binding protein n=2 Tax=Prauserella salsuginis group TaxID=2893672 RepID=A0A839XLM6_9PSEU|nr:MULTISPECIES: ABC transporter substrate-binding protein [Prauserella salsuginis group]MBB3664160.1 NitT/TauT family transport system substrate-binding protein [Prauserella sediminis]MCR3721612.1 NitT/TauT family transport system substrate-binding protein [Prauserella flava]MCR3734304.1 NitT/TauT family transport system substrate-binding protein [Prauserella salsuginis]
MKLRALTAGTAATALLLAAGCGGSEGETVTNAEGEELDKVTLTLNWYPYGEHAPFYYGKQQGIYEEHGISLDIRAGQGSQKTVQATAAGQTDFGWADTPALLAGVSQGLDVKSIGVYLQTTPSSVQFFSEEGISSPDDLKGKTVASTAGDALTNVFPLFLEANGLSEQDVQVQNTDAAGKMAAVMQDQTDALLGYATDQGPTMQEKAGKDVSYLRWAEHGLNFYSNGLLTAQDVLDDRGDLAQRMVAATTEAWEQAGQDREAAVDAMEGASEQLPSKPVLTEQFDETLELLHTDATEGERPGVNTPEDWEKTIGIFADAGVIDEAGEPGEYWERDLVAQE